MINALRRCVFFCSVLLLASCASVEKSTPSAKQEAIRPLNCIGILPARAIADNNTGLKTTTTETLRRGAIYMDSVLASELKGRENIKIISAKDLGYPNGDTIAGIAAAIDHVAGKINCDAVLIITMRRFEQREGSEYAVDDPASASFDMRLLDARSKNVIWAGDFNETQESLLSNIFSFGKAKSRGFKWITVEELVAQGVKERLADCPYL